jgi:O-antigen/teichoic acid export membrane protein
MKKSRSKQALTNTVMELVLEMVTAICSFILPRLILSHFGSTYNGVVSSITQFISCLSLLKSGIGAVTVAALYKPLAEKNIYGISEIVNATSGFMKKISLIFIGAIGVFASVYPFIVKDDFEWLFCFTLILIISFSTFAQYFFGLAYQMVLKADHKYYIISLVTIVSTVLNTIVASALILAGFGIHAVKIGSAIVFVLPPIFYNIWVKRRYHIDTSVPANYELIGQRWDAFGHQVANFINNNTDIIITTIVLGVKEVSVYTIFYMVANAVKKVIHAIGTGTQAAFGNMIAKYETENLRKRFIQFELVIFYVTTFLLTVTLIMFIPFISVYTKGIEDVNYTRFDFGCLVCLATYWMCIKIPYEQLVYAAGEFKKTRNGAFVEAGINICTSVALAYLIGLNGIIIGTIIAIAYRTMRYHIFVCRNIVERSVYSIASRFLYSIIVVATCYGISLLFPISTITNYFTWVLYAVIVSLYSIIFATVVGIILFRGEFVGVLNSLRQIVSRKIAIKKR